MLIRVRRPSVAITDHPYKADPTGKKMATDAIQQAVWDAASVEIPPGRFRIGRRDTVGITPGRPEHIGISIPSDRRIWGHEGLSILVNELDDPTADLTLAWDNGRENVVSWLWLGWDTNNQTIDGLTFEGQGPSGLTPDSAIENLQMACIDAGYEHWESEGAQVVRKHRGPENVRIRNCHFRNQFGFSVHARGGGKSWVVDGGSTTDCMNGLNLNVDDLTVRDHSTLRSEGFECAGTGHRYDGNRFRDALFIAFAFGGHADDTGSPRHRSYGARITNTVIHGSHRYGLQITANTQDTLVQNSHITRVGHYGLFAGDFTTALAAQPRDVTFDLNTVTDCGGEDESAAIAMFNVKGGRLSRNVARYTEGDERFTQRFGLLTHGCGDLDIEPTNDFRGRVEGAHAP